jgi:CRISPR-associated endonuclease Cas2
MKHLFSKEDKLQKLRASALAENDSLEKVGTIDPDDCGSISERIRRILNIVNRKERPSANMLFFVMYDISSNKVRTLVAKYLIEKGCTRVQCSIFLADLHVSQYEQIKSDLAEVQAAYENNDSILVVPISEGYLDAMKIIGHDINVDMITHKDNTLFF